MKNQNTSKSHSGESNTTSTSRRDFVKTATATAGLLAVGVPSVHAAGEESEIRVGLVGCGGRGTGAAVNAMKADRNVRIVAMADLFETSIQRSLRSLRKQSPEQCTVEPEQCFSGFESYKQLLEVDLDVVLLASPPHYRADHLEASVDAGKHIFCEKPIATDPTGVRRVEATCKIADQKGLNVVSGLCWRYDKGMQETVKRVLDGEVGKIITTQADYLTGVLWSRPRKEGMTEMEYQCNNWNNFVWLSGDHIVEQFIHSLDKALWLHNDEAPVSAYGIGGRQQRSDLLHGNIYDHFSVVYQWADGTRTYANTRQMQGCFNRTEDFVFGTEGKATLCKHRIEGTNAWKFEGAEVQMHQAEQDELFKALRGERERINNADYMCKSTMMAILGREACYTGKTLTYDEVASSPQDFRPPAYHWGDGPAVEVAEPSKYKFPTAKQA